jgi:predicted metal-dependent hydrolase
MSEIIIKRLAASRSLRLRVYDDGRVVLTAPNFIGQGKIDAFITEHRPWIEERLGKVRSRQEFLTEKRGKLPLRGRDYEFRLTISTNSHGARIKDGQLVVTAPKEDHRIIRAELEKWYRLQAKRHYEQRVPLLADLIGRDLSRVSIRDSRTRWGSCSSRNAISLNWRLIMAPDWVSDYVIFHELAHLTHMNHSKRFWQLVESYFPRYQLAEKWLKHNHQLLYF